MGRYTSLADCRRLFSTRGDEIDNDDVNAVIEKAEFDVDSGLAPMYDVPFSDAVKHPKGVPPKIRWLSAELVVCILHSRLYDQGEINETDYGGRCYARVNKQIADLVNCEAGLVYLDGTIVPRIGKCPQDAPTSANGAPISNTLGDPVIFTLEDPIDTTRTYYGGP